MVNGERSPHFPYRLLSHSGPSPADRARLACPRAGGGSPLLTRTESGQGGQRDAGSLGLEKHPDKTFIGRIEKGFDVLGCHFRPGELSVAKKTVENFVARAIRLYEQEPEEAGASSRVGAYVRRWVRWAEAGLDEAKGSWEGELTGQAPSFEQYSPVMDKLGTIIPNFDVEAIPYNRVDQSVRRCIGRWVLVDI